MSLNLPSAPALLRGAVVAAAALGLWLACLALQPPPTPLIKAVGDGDLTRTEALLQQDPASVNRVCLGRAALHLAVLKGNAPMVELLLRHGADIEARDALGDTPLHAAAFGVGKAVIKPLLAHGANPDARNHAGQTPLHLAAYAWPNLYARDQSRTLLRAGAAPDPRDQAGLTPRDLAVIMGNEPVIDLLERP
ncbi:MAG: ankyrin repeat domain-containing protein [Desulfarculaceae bacterium]|nr:ankyrin repeat domain-containing protein [Desulfarculaceae bacterium]